MPKERLDKILVERGLAGTQPKAQAMIMAGLVFHGTERLEKPGRLVSTDLDLAVKTPPPFVSRGGLKLEEALDRFRLDVRGKACADIGASTGGFTDCLLQRGADLVYAIDVDTRQLDESLRRDSRVVPVEKNARFLVPEDFPRPPRMITMDVSFISVLKILPALKTIGEAISSSRVGDPRKGEGSGAESLDPVPFAVLSLIKPQFEAEKGRVGKKGVIRDPAVRGEILKKVVHVAAGMGFRAGGLIRCSTPGQKGNREFFALWTIDGLPREPDLVLKWIEEAIRDESD